MGISHSHPDQIRRAHSSGSTAPSKPNTSAPSAAEAVQPYQYIAGARNDIAGSTIPRVVRAQEDDALLGIDGEQCEIQLECDHVENSESSPVSECKPAECMRRRHEPNPMMLFTTWPVRKPHHTMKARIPVKAARIR